MSTVTLVEYEDASPEVMAVIGVARRTNGIGSGLKVPVDECCLK